MIGQRSLRLIALTFGIVDTLTRGVNAELYQRFWKRALCMSSVASRLSRERDDVICDDVYTAGLLADIGMLVFAQVHGEHYAIFSQKFVHGPELIESERCEFGVAHPYLGARLLERW